MSIKRHIPNAITSANLVCGCIGIVLCLRGSIEQSVYFIWLAMVFDFFDGFTARLLKVSSPIGKELDSLADMVTFGALPAMIMYQLISNVSSHEHLPYIVFLIAVFSALRLAKFNIDETQSDSFVGVPTPANALFISSLIFILPEFTFLNNTTILVVLTVICSYWLVMPMRLLALKFKNYSFADNKLRYLFLITSVVLLVFLQLMALPLIIISYLIFSGIQLISNK